MGADGHLQLMRRTVWDARYPDLAPETVGLTARRILDVDVVTRYWDTEGRDDFDHCRAARLAERADRTRARLAMFDLDRYADRVTGTAPHRRMMSTWTSNGADEQLLLRDLREVEADPDALAASERVREAQQWFEANAEDVEVWT